MAIYDVTYFHVVSHGYSYRTVYARNEKQAIRKAKKKLLRLMPRDMVGEYKVDRVVKLKSWSEKAQQIKWKIVK